MTLRISSSTHGTRRLCPLLCNLVSFTQTPDHSFSDGACVDSVPDLRDLSGSFRDMFRTVFQPHVNEGGSPTVTCALSSSACLQTPSRPRAPDSLVASRRDKPKVGDPCPEAVCSSCHAARPASNCFCPGEIPSRSLLRPKLFDHVLQVDR